jgi:predicted alpha/beta-hydrolase family hydrolase
MNAESQQLHPSDCARAVRIPAGSICLDGDLNVPDNATGVVLFALGSGSSRCSPCNQFAAQHLQRAGLGTLMFDLLSAEEAQEDMERGHLRFNIGLLTQRLVCAAHWVPGEDEARQLPLGFFGASTGGAAALVAAADLGRSIAAVVSRGGRPDLAGNALRRVKSPTLLIVGERDDAVLDLNREAFDMLACEKELCVIADATHLFQEPGSLEQASGAAADWFSRSFQPQAGGRFRR